MKVQYFGDVNDYRKYVLLRLLAKSGEFKIGVCWMLTPADDRTDGKQTSATLREAARLNGGHSIPTCSTY